MFTIHSVSAIFDCCKALPDDLVLLIADYARPLIMRERFEDCYTHRLDQISIDPYNESLHDVLERFASYRISSLELFFHQLFMPLSIDGEDFFEIFADFVELATVDEFTSHYDYWFYRWNEIVVECYSKSL
tara:strand:+ start:1231 stop:1623 length:393 start_codon:yes stop_codon:yes gene_type:complete